MKRVAHHVLCNKVLEGACHRSHVTKTMYLCHGHASSTTALGVTLSLVSRQPAALGFFRKVSTVPSFSDGKVHKTVVATVGLNAFASWLDVVAA